MTRGSKATASISMAFSLAGSVTTAPIPSSSKKITLSTTITGEKSVLSSMSSSPAAVSYRGFSLYKGVSDRPLGWKSKRKAKPVVGQASRDANLMRWDGARRTTSEWDALRRDPELWYHGGNCLVHLYGPGLSKRGPAFRVPFQSLLDAGCRPLIDKFLLQDFDSSPVSDSTNGSGADGDNWDRPKTKKYELYIPVPPAAEKKQAMLYHIATRNFFAWIFKKPMVGPHLGGALVTLLRSMNEFRSVGANNVDDILDYMDQEGYADMRNEPNHALAVLFLAETLQFRDIWIDAYAHCVGMNDLLSKSPEFKHIGTTSRNLIRLGRLEMDMRLDLCSKSLGNFLENELSTANIGLSIGARDHLDRFRAFLQAYYVDKFGYYPPSPTYEGITAFPSHVYQRMLVEFQNLYDFLVDETFTLSDVSPLPAQGGICVLQNVQAFDQRYHHDPLPNPLPLLPQTSWNNSLLLRPRVGWTGKADKSKGDGRLMSLSSLAKASNRRKIDLMKCSFVKAFCEFEKNYLFSDFKLDKANKISLVDARKVCWIMIYAMLQTLLANTAVPGEVRDVHDVPYNLCVRLAGCPPWKEEKPPAGVPGKHENEVYQSSDDAPLEGDISALSSPYPESSDPCSSIKPDIAYFQLTRQSSSNSTSSNSTSGRATMRRDIIRRALFTLRNMPELRQPEPVRKSFREIIVYGYGNGLNLVSVNSSTNSVPHLLNNEGNILSDLLPPAGFSDAPLPPSVGNFENNGSKRNENKGGIANVQDFYTSASIKMTESSYDKIDTDLSRQLPQPLYIPERNAWNDRLTNC